MIKVKRSIKISLLALTIVPIILLSTIVTTFAAEKLKSTMVDDAKANLKSTVYSILSTYCYGNSDKITLDDNTLKIGNSKISDNVSMVDTIKKQTDTDVTIFAKDTRILTSIVDKSGSRVINSKATNEVIETVLNKGEDYFSEETDIQGQNYCAYYTPIKNDSGDIIGMIFAGRPTAELDKIKLDSTLFFVIFDTVFVIIFAIISFIKSNSISKSLQSATNYLSNIAIGDLTQIPDAKLKTRKDEIGLLFNTSHDLCDSLKNIVSEIHQVSNYLITHSNELHDQSTICLNNTSSVNYAMNYIASGAVSQAESTKDASDKVIDIGNLIKDITDSVDSLNSNSSEIQKAEHDANYIIKDSHEYNEVTVQAVKKIAIQAEKTNESAQKINEAIELITDIAEQTNLLSLNASIEAARAGEAGKGFAVVAEEIQKLADESTRSAQTIKDTIDELLMEADNTVETMKEVESAVNNQKLKINETKDKFDTVSNGIVKSIDNVSLINSKATNLSNNKDEVIDLLENLSSISEENAAATEKTTASMSELSSTIQNISDAADKLTDLAKTLEESVKVFIIK